MSKHQGKFTDQRQQKTNESRQTNVNPNQTQNPNQKTPQGGTGTGNLSKNWQTNFNNPTSRLQTPIGKGKRK